MWGGGEQTNVLFSSSVKGPYSSSRMRCPTFAYRSADRLIYRYKTRTPPTAHMKKKRGRILIGNGDGANPILVNNPPRPKNGRKRESSGRSITRLPTIGATRWVNQLNSLMPNSR